MAISFVTGSYHLFNFFLLSTTFSHSHLHCAQLAAAALGLFVSATILSIQWLSRWCIRIRRDAWND